RPGVKAMRELGLRGPLREAGLGKSWIRRWSAERGRPTADIPAAACQASRFPHGTPLTEEALRRVERAEAFLRHLGLRQVRVRHHGEVARIEAGADDIAGLASQPRRDEIVRELTRQGYRRVALDLAGYQSGSLNPPPPANPA
ncbi:MAG: TIGR00268 family protein, partial [Planctomycetota bacterium]|nr:TIGR00268 family protein [Planctomycetota bacterium]